MGHGTGPLGGIIDRSQDREGHFITPVKSCFNTDTMPLDTDKPHCKCEICGVYECGFKACFCSYDIGLSYNYHNQKHTVLFWFMDYRFQAILFKTQCVEIGKAWLVHAMVLVIKNVKYKCGIYFAKNKGLSSCYFYLMPVLVCPSMCHQACLQDNSSPLQTRITKFGSEVLKTLFKIPILLWDNWPWPSRSHWTSKSKFIPS